MFAEALKKAREAMDMMAIIRLDNQKTSIFDDNCDDFHSEDDFLLTRDEAKDLEQKFKKEVCLIFVFVFMVPTV